MNIKFKNILKILIVCLFILSTGFRADAGDTVPDDTNSTVSIDENSGNSDVLNESTEQGTQTQEDSTISLPQSDQGDIDNTAEQTENDTVSTPDSPAEDASQTMTSEPESENDQTQNSAITDENTPNENLTSEQESTVENSENSSDSAQDYQQNQSNNTNESDSTTNQTGDDITTTSETSAEGQDQNQEIIADNSENNSSEEINNTDDSQNDTSMGTEVSNEQSQEEEAVESNSTDESTSADNNVTVVNSDSNTDNQNQSPGQIDANSDNSSDSEITTDNNNPSVESDQSDDQTNDESKDEIISNSDSDDENSSPDQALESATEETDDASGTENSENLTSSEEETNQEEVVEQEETENKEDQNADVEDKEFDETEDVQTDETKTEADIVILENAEDIDNNYWTFDNPNNVNASVDFVYDKDLDSQVVQFQTDDFSTTFSLFKEDITDINLAGYSTITWNMRPDSDLVLGIKVETTIGVLTIWCGSGDQASDFELEENDIFIDLDTENESPAWIELEQNVDTILTNAYPDEKLLDVIEISVKGNGLIDNIALSIPEISTSDDQTLNNETGQAVENAPDENQVDSNNDQELNDENQTIYARGTENDIDNWKVFYRASKDAKVELSFDEEKQDDVFEFSGSSDQSIFRLLDLNGEKWQNRDQFILQWSQNFNDDFVVYVDLETTQGHKYLCYLPQSYRGTHNRGFVYSYLDNDSVDGHWHTYTQDLQADIDVEMPGVEILNINGVLIQGLGKIDNVKLLKTLPDDKNDEEAGSNSIEDTTDPDELTQ